MIYLILAVDLLLLSLVAGLAVRFLRASPERRKEMLRPRMKNVLISVAAVVALFLVTCAACFSLIGLTGMRATSAAKDYLQERFGARDSWSIGVLEHVERSKKPEAVAYRIHYRYGEKEGTLLAEYVERDGKLVFKISPEDK